VVSSPVVSGPTTAWHLAGCGAKAAVYSFNGNKILNTSGGGMLASGDARLIEHARKLSQQARDPAPHYEHTEIGYNYRMSNILAAIGRGQLRVLDERVAAKRRICQRYQELLGDLPGVTFMPEAPTGQCNRWLTVILIGDQTVVQSPDFRFQLPACQHFSSVSGPSSRGPRSANGVTPESVRLALEAENIESRPVWKPMHLQPVFRSCRIRGGDVSERFFRLGLCLPSGTAMTPSDIERVAAIVRRCHVRSS
jgi:dTDP-4-amino-4,6-dideoxygalactose transaminase